MKLWHPKARPSAAAAEKKQAEIRPSLGCGHIRHYPSLSDAVATRLETTDQSIAVSVPVERDGEAHRTRLTGPITRESMLDLERGERVVLTNRQEKRPDGSREFRGIYGKATPPSMGQLLASAGNRRTRAHVAVDTKLMRRLAKAMGSDRLHLDIGGPRDGIVVHALGRGGDSPGLGDAVGILMPIATWGSPPETVDLMVSDHDADVVLGAPTRFDTDGGDPDEGTEA